MEPPVWYGNQIVILTSGMKATLVMEEHSTPDIMVSIITSS
ncbi:Uncharacterised protein [Serratia fonticola]|nr:Uncharacterised protein [Serratia fonticola]CAI1997289.1 Uncharacterised protein [Serratia fonticola]CAI2000750.1 Uncharacterised protein [Serratia fonticola]